MLDSATCKPIANGAVDIWHCDAGGTYSGVSGNSGRFLRGIQKTNAKGVASFDTIYPGWYQGRTVHIHVKVYVGGNAQERDRSLRRHARDGRETLVVSRFSRC